MKHTLSRTATLTSFLFASGILIAGLSWELAHAATEVITTNYPASFCQLPQPKGIIVYGNGAVGNDNTGRQGKLNCGFDRKGLSRVSSVYMSYQDNHAQEPIFCRVQLVDAFGKVLQKVTLRSKEGKGKDIVGTRFPKRGELDANQRYAGFCFLPPREKGRNPSVLYGITIYERIETD